MSIESRALTRNQTLVLDSLAAAGAPLTAYRLLDELRGAGLKAPVQIYRALEPLVGRGLVHRLESLNAYIACRHPHGHRGATIFAICSECGEVEEYTDQAVKTRLARRAAESQFTMASAIVEMRGLCVQCAESLSIS